MGTGPPSREINGNGPAESWKLMGTGPFWCDFGEINGNGSVFQGNHKGNHKMVQKLMGPFRVFSG